MSAASHKITRQGRFNARAPVGKVDIDFFRNEIIVKKDKKASAAR